MVESMELMDLRINRQNGLYLFHSSQEQYSDYVVILIPEYVHTGNTIKNSISIITDMKEYAHIDARNNNADISINEDAGKNLAVTLPKDLPDFEECKPDELIVLYNQLCPFEKKYMSLAKYYPFISTLLNYYESLPVYHPERLYGREKKFSGSELA
jgi:hypothetical protein